jgi:hypothetical protein
MRAGRRDRQSPAPLDQRRQIRAVLLGAARMPEAEVRQVRAVAGSDEDVLG